MAELNVLTQVKNIVSATLKIPLDKLDVEADFDSFGIDSIIAMELMSNLSKEMNISITPAQFTEVNTIKELAFSIEELVSDTVAVKEEVIATIEVEEVPQTVIQPKKVKQSPQRILTSNNRSNSRRRSAFAEKNIVANIKKEFAIDLSYGKFSSIEAIADALVTNHLAELLAHYNIGAVPKTLPSKTVKVTTNHKTTSTPLRETEDIAIVGISCNFPDAPNVTSYWNNLIEGKNSIREIEKSRWNPELYYAEKASDTKTNSKWGALIEDHDCFDAKFFQIQDEEAILMDPQERLILQEVYKSFQDAGINPLDLKGSNTGVYASYEYLEYEHYLRNNIHQLELKEKPFFSSSSPTYYLANRLSFIFDFNGPSETFNVNCAGSAVAINRAYQSLLDNENDVAIVTGASLNLFADDFIALSKYGMLSPNGTCAVFDDEANGFSRGEGVAAVVLKRLSDAEKDNNKIYGVIKSSNQSNRGSARFMQEIDTESITNVISTCYEKAAINPETVDYIEVDGYATKWGDSFEYEGIKKAFAKVTSKEKTCALGSLKGNIGNLESVNGLASLIKLALSMHYKKFPASITRKKTNSFIDLDNPNHVLYFANEVIPFGAIRKEEDTLIRAGINSFADTGVNVHILIEEYNKQEYDVQTGKATTPQLFILSAKDKNRLLESVDRYIDFLLSADERLFTNAIYTLQIGREPMEERLAIIAASFEELLKKLNLVKKNSFDHKKFGLEKEGIFNGSAKQDEENPLDGIFTSDMAEMLIYNTDEKDRWQRLAKLWITGFDVPWNLIWENKNVRPVSLPLYPFYKDRYWAEVTGENTIKSIIHNKKEEEIVEEIDKKATIEKEWFFYISESEVDEKTAPNALERMELFLQQEIALLLKSPVALVNTKDNFLDLGLNSIDIGTFVSNTMNLLNITMSPAIIFNNPDISSLSNYLQETYSEKLAHLHVTKDQKKAKEENTSTYFQDSSEKESHTEKILIPLQTHGNKTPIFAVSPGGNGTTLAFQYLVQALGNEQPFYGLEFVMNNEVNEEITIEKIAQTNVEALQKIQPEGSYRLLGLSNGGMIAFEMAKILTAKGFEIELLSFLDCFSPKQPVIDMFDEIVGVFKGKFSTSSTEELDIDVVKLKEMPEEDRFDYLYSAISQYGFTIPKEQFEHTYRNANIMDKSCRAYQPTPLKAKINTLLFRATDGYMEGYEELPEDYGWNQLLTKEIQVSHIESDHFSITDKTQSKEIASTINILLKALSLKEMTNS